MSSGQFTNKSEAEARGQGKKYNFENNFQGGLEGEGGVWKEKGECYLGGKRILDQQERHRISVRERREESEAFSGTEATEEFHAGRIHLRKPADGEVEPQGWEETLRAWLVRYPFPSSWFLPGGRVLNRGSYCKLLSWVGASFVGSHLNHFSSIKIQNRCSEKQKKKKKSLSEERKQPLILKLQVRLVKRYSFP